ncbi:helix-turn-helix domain-containing protein [Fodinicola feengrottensis]|uniref:helix-turn-helix domain-containing protein n=1 Tax=Fodinicola feengrottensis TaxID=435914 RepID=UPI0024412522|nr:helix-turn-helix transcriptional regulator [Fodinicola feengrottensis]
MARSYVRARRLGIALREYRNAAGLTLEQVAEEVAVTKATVSRMETAKTISRPAIIRAMLQLYNVPRDEIERFAQLAKDVRSKDSWWRAYDLPGRVADLVALESDAISISVYETNVVPGLAQTEAYCRAVVTATTPVVMADAAVDEWVAFRMRRQLRILDDEDAPQVSIIIDDSVLDRFVGDSRIMAEQIEHLQMLGDRPNITVQVVPVAAGIHPGLPGSITLLEFDDLMPANVYIDTVPGDVLLDTPAAIQRTQQAFNALRARAATPEASRDLLTARRPKEDP